MTWLLRRGLTREARHWGDFASRFATALHEKSHDKTEDVIALDLPGNGEFHRQRSPASVGHMTDFFRAQIMARGLTSALPVRVFAMSLGAMVATDWALRFPQEIERLVLVNTSFKTFSGPTERLRLNHWPTLAHMALQWRLPEAAPAIEHTLHRLTCQETLTRAADVAAWLQIRRDAPVSAANAARQLWAAARYTGGSIAPICPVLVLSSARDALVDPRCSLRLADAWHCAHHTHPTAGHDLPHDDADWVGERVQAWLWDTDIRRRAQP